MIDAKINGDLNPPGAGVWEIPGLGINQPAIANALSLNDHFILTKLVRPNYLLLWLFHEARFSEFYQFEFLEEQKTK